ncbi:Ubiquitin carboxyl-terminal hydrolase 23 [Platanthera zijinensis]|uniref:Ubiquitin carboxyl-terminal hydrolase n=1 Tax=Platanthera zijinensis TaxID=2320716 RepID=A0AAP0BQG2_9ASPA
MAAAGQPLLHRRIEFHLARRPCTAVPLSSGDFRLETLNPGSSEKRWEASGSAVGSSEAESAAHEKRSAGGEFHDRGLDPELSFRIGFQKIGAGLENLGNTCYLNSVLQCLTYTEPFAAYLQSGKHKSTCRAAGFCAMCALQNHVMDALQSTGKILKPFHLVRNLRCISRTFQNSRQEDAHEYMVNLLESMHKCCLPYGVPSESPSAYERSLVHKIFGGQLRSQVKCMKCSYCSNKFDPFLDLSLEIVGADSVKKALAHFTAPEQLDDGGRQYKCQHCKEKVRASKQLTVHKPPYVLTIHLKRFGSCIRGEKINKKVEFGPSLDLKPFVSGLHEEELKYTLYGVLVHAGWSTRSGHYFCYVRTSTGLWYSLDDNHVSQVSEKAVLSREAYMLFYVRDRTAIKQSLLVERKLSTPGYSSAKIIYDGAIHGLPVPLADSRGKHLFNNQDTLVHSNGHVTTVGSSFQVSDDVPTNGLHSKTLPLNSKLPFFGPEKGDATNRIAQVTSTKQKIESSSTLECNDDRRPFSTSNSIHGPIKEAASSKFMEDEANDLNMEKGSTGQQRQKGREGFLKLMETKSVKPLKLNTSVGSVQEESPVVPEMENSVHGGRTTEVILKKPKVPLLANDTYFGRKQIFFMSLRLHKKHKMRNKKHHPKCRNKINKRRLDLSTESQGTSTSEKYRTDDMHSTLSFGNDACSTLREKLAGEKAVKFNNDLSRMNGTEIHSSCTSGDIPEISKEPSRSSSSTEGKRSVKFKNAEDEDILPNCSLNLLKASLREATVASWDVKDLLPSQINELEDAPKRKNCYLLDEWDEEYDRGKRKKLKSRRWFDGSNPFQETADLREKEKRNEKIR